MNLLLTELHAEALTRDCTITLLALAKKAAASKAPQRRRVAKWPRASWMNAFAVQEAHDLEVMHIETEALVAVFGERRKANG